MNLCGLVANSTVVMFFSVVDVSIALNSANSNGKIVDADHGGFLRSKLPSRTSTTISSPSPAQEDSPPAPATVVGDGSLPQKIPSTTEPSPAQEVVPPAAVLLVELPNKDDKPPTWWSSPTSPKAEPSTTLSSPVPPVLTPSNSNTVVTSPTSGYRVSAEPAASGPSSPNEITMPSDETAMSAEAREPMRLDEIARDFMWDALGNLALLEGSEKPTEV